jgi:Response regulator containing CheY-like receiver domain and AraC-type DNA-binding domain
MHTLMLIDDEKAILDGLKIIISRVLPECRIAATAYDAEEGVRVAMEIKPEIIITDIMLLKENGLSMIEKLREAGVSSRFIILSAYQEFKFAQKGMELGVKYYLTKPVEENELQKCVRCVIEESRQAPDSTQARIAEVVQSTDKKDIILQIRQYLEENFQDDIKLSDLSKQFNINMYYLSQLFKDKTGQNYSDYLSRLRVNYAKALLIKTDMKVYEVCAAVGYSDSTYFAKLFERIVGCTPTEYRKSIIGSRS